MATRVPTPYTRVLTEDRNSSVALHRLPLRHESFARVFALVAETRVVNGQLAVGRDRNMPVFVAGSAQHIGF